MSAGFSWLALGFLTPAVRADLVADALGCLDTQAQHEAQRGAWLAQADSLGRQIEAARSEGRSAPKDLLRRAEKIQRTAMDRELELMTERARCRALSSRALSDCVREIGAIEAVLASGRGNGAQASRLLGLREARSRLEAALAVPATLGYPALAPDSTDTQETLRAKLQYYHDVRGYLQGLEERVAARLAQVEQERRTLVEAQRFLQDLAFLDEGGRVSPGASAPGGPNPDGMGRPFTGSVGAGSGSENLELVLGLTPVTPEDSDQLIRLLRGFQAEIQRELESVSNDSKTIERRILPDIPAPR
jgi:hypothetical protein